MDRQAVLDFLLSASAAFWQDREAAQYWNLPDPSQRLRSKHPASSFSWSVQDGCPCHPRLRCTYTAGTGSAGHQQAVISVEFAELTLPDGQIHGNAPGHCGIEILPDEGYLHSRLMLPERSKAR